MEIDLERGLAALTSGPEAPVQIHWMPEKDTIIVTATVVRPGPSDARRGGYGSADSFV